MARHAALVASLDDTEDVVRRLLAELDDSIEGQVARLLVGSRGRRRPPVTTNGWSRCLAHTSPVRTPRSPARSPSVEVRGIGRGCVPGGFDGVGW
ncbi:MAG: hypothetical protein L0H59_13035 [Tomitella sp.]|nr:hypothetical protein [Tomitella sp.]